MSNDADQKPMWREFWLKNVRGEAFVFEFYQDNCIHVIEAEPALAEIEKWKREYENLFNRKFEGPFDEIEKLRAELERERMRLAACGVAAMSNTIATAAKIDECHDDYNSRKTKNIAEQLIEVLDNLDVPSFVEGARWQHSQNRAALSAMKGKSGNDWKQMDEAKDAFARTVDQLNAAVGQQDIEIDKLRAENAILREGLAVIKIMTSPIGFAGCPSVANEALTAADKVRGEG